MASTSTMDPVRLFIEKLNQDQLFNALREVRDKFGVFDGTNISKYLNIYYDEMEISGVNDVNIIKNGVRKQTRKPKNRKRRFNGNLRFAQYGRER